MEIIIGLIILIASFLAMGVVVYRKIPLLAELSLEGIEQREGLIKRLKYNFKNNIAPKTASSSQTLLLKTLSKIRILLLKGENRMAHWLKALRERSAKPKIDATKAFSDNYWERIKVRKRGRRPRVEENSETEENKI